MGEPTPSAGVYAISVAAELTGLTVRSLRLLERHGLLHPARTEGGTRRFSRNDLRRTRRIAELMADGVNLAGIGKILDLEHDTAGLRGANAALQADNSALRAANSALRAGQHRRGARHRRASGDSTSPAGPGTAPPGEHRDQPSRPG